MPSWRKIRSRSTPTPSRGAVWTSDVETMLRRAVDRGIFRTIDEYMRSTR
jgi:hypothetical protein